MPKLEPVLRAGRADFRELLEKRKSFQETFNVNSDGTLVLEGVYDEGPMTFTVSSLTLPWKAFTPGTTVYTPDDLRVAAAEFIKEYAEVTVTFAEDRTRVLFHTSRASRKVHKG